MDKSSHTYTFVFALTVCVVCSLVLAAVSKGLQPRQRLNEDLDIKKNIFKVVGAGQLLDGQRPDQIMDLFEQYFRELFVNDAGQFSDDDDAVQDRLPVYVYEKAGQTDAYIFPIQGKGLWSTLYGYLSIEADGETVRGITFYKHGETPGLGGEIEREWFQSNFQGKKIWDQRQGAFVAIRVVKGRVADQIASEQAAFYVDGISGATMTSKGVTQLLEAWLQRYELFLQRIRQRQHIS